MQGSSLWGLLEAFIVLTIIGRTSVDSSLGLKGSHGCILQGLVWTDFPTHGFLSVPKIQISYLVASPPSHALEQGPQLFNNLQ